MIKTFIILGAPRSATSLVAGSLHHYGICMGQNFDEPNANNPQGFWEEKDFVDLNIRILKSAGGTSFNPPPREAILAQKARFSQEIQEVIKKHERPLWGVKDPRLTLTLELFLPYFKNPHLICCWRDPKDIAESWAKFKKTWTYEERYRVAKIYHQRLLDLLNKIYK